MEPIEKYELNGGSWDKKERESFDWKLHVELGCSSRIVSIHYPELDFHGSCRFY